MRLAELESFDLDFKQMKSRGMADGGCDIADDEVLRRSITKTLLEIDELKVVAELEMLEQSARMKDAEASKIQEERLKAWETERMMTEEERTFQEKLRFMIEEEERKKWEEVLAAQREIAEKEESKRAREREAKKEAEKEVRLRKTGRRPRGRCSR